ncbi:MAG TPA: hypothetical protein VHZ03_00050 [Trebonia sp.]|jgi:hypothetical protein|nr:hypothetical protein [Trebonia sp.]
MSEPGIREQLIGCWRLAGFDVTAEGGQTDHPLGEDPLGTVQASVIPSGRGTTQIRQVQFREPGTLVLSASEQSPPRDGVQTTTTIPRSRGPHGRT